MNCFQLIKTVLDEIYLEIPAEEEQKDVLIRERSDYLQARYLNLKNADGPIDYADPVTRFAYIYRYVTCHANIVYQLIYNSQKLSQIFDAKKVNVTCIGGGPGSDFLGVLKFMMNTGKQASIRCNLFDKEQAWGESWSDIDDKVGPEFKVYVYFQQFDITNPNTWLQQQKYLYSDLFTMIYFISEVYRMRAEAEQFFINLFDKAKPGSMFLYVDNNNEAFYQWFDKMAFGRINTISSERLIMKLPTDEEKGDLGIYYDKFGYPKLAPDIAYRICMKPA